MPRHIVIKNGDDALTAPIVAYLEQNYGIEPADIKSVALVSEVGDVQLLTVTLMVKRVGVTARDVDPLGRGVGGDATQRGVEVCAYDGYEESDPAHDAAHWPAVERWRAESEAGDPEVQRSDLHKRDENVLRS